MKRNVANGLPKSRRQITDEEAVRIAIARFSTHPPRPLGELSKDFGRDEVVISRTITKALREGLVEVVAARHPKFKARQTQLERQLRERYRDLASCIVLESGSVTTPEDGDHLHRELGYAVATVIGEGPLFRDGDVIGLGSGRGVYYTIQGLLSQPSMRARVTLCSLTGQVYATDHSEQLNLLLDADIHLGLLGPRFSRPATLHPMSNSIVCSDPGETTKVLTRWAQDQDRLGVEASKAEITHALLGVGVLAEGHRFYKEVKMETRRRTPSLRPIEKYLERLVEVCDEILQNFEGIYCPVADIVNRLFFVPPPPRLRMSAGVVRDLENRISEAIDEVNKRVVAVSDEQLKRISNIVLVAGSRLKGAAVRRLLMDGYPIRFLCVDQQIAEELLTPDGG